MVRHDGTGMDQRTDWLGRAVVAGFVATALMTVVLAVAYGFALILASPNPTAPTVFHWLWGLTHNVVTERTASTAPAAVILHVLAGMLWAIVYAGMVEPHLRGPGWRRGLLFSLIPWLFSLFVFLPALSGGFLGLALGAGPLPIIGNLIAHLIYGATLGGVYALGTEHYLGGRERPVSPREFVMLSRVEQTMAGGIVIGLVAGGLVGWLAALVWAGGQAELLGLLLGALGGAVAGLLAGSFAGLSIE